LRINTNIASLSAQRQLARTTQAIARSLERLSTGRRVNSARDDASALAISNGLEAQGRALRESVLQLNQGRSALISTDGALQTQMELVQRMRELAVQAASGTLSVEDRGNLNIELIQLYEEFDRISSNLEFNGINLLDGSAGTLRLQAGSNKRDQINIEMADARGNSIFTEAQGTTAFSARQTMTSTSYSPSMIVADLNHDSKNDIIEVVTGALNIRRGRSDGTFADAQSIATTGTLSKIDSMDLDGDGDLDILARNGTSQIYQYINDNGNFTRGTLIDSPSVSWSISDFTHSDMDGDGDQDLALVAYDTSADDNVMAVYLNQGSGSYAFAASSSLGLGALAPTIFSGNINSSASAEIMSSTGIYSYSSGTINLLSSLSGVGDQVIDLGDYDGDGDLDLIGGEFGHAIGTPWSYSIFKNNGSGTFSEATTFKDANDVIAGGLLSFDMNADGKEEIVYNAGGTLKIRSFNGTTSTVISTQTAAGGSGSAFIGDINNDGVSDYGYSNGTNLYLHSTLTSQVSATDEIDVTTQSAAVNLLSILDTALNNLSSIRANLGANMNRLDYALNSNSLTAENLEEARSRMIDVDVAEETSHLTRQQILQQAQVSVLSQANLALSQVLSLLKF